MYSAVSHSLFIGKEKLEANKFGRKSKQPKILQKSDLLCKMILGDLLPSDKFHISLAPFIERNGHI